MLRIVKGCIWTAAALLAGCGSPAGQTALPLSQPVSQPATASGPWPGSGASFVFAGTLVQTTTAGSSKKTTTLQLSQKIQTKSTTYGKRPVIDYSGTETQTGHGKPATTAFDAYAAQVPSKIRKGSDVQVFKTTTNDSTGTQTTVTYGSGNGVFDQVPEIPQARWTNTAARAQSIVDSTGSVHDGYNADGSYDETASFTAGTHALLQSYGDGNAVYQWPLDGAPNGGWNSTMTFSPPKGGHIQVEFTNATGFPISSGTDLDVWYPKVPPVLASDSSADMGSVAIPSACNVAKSYGKTATEIAEKQTRLDVVFGEYETTQRTAYVASPYGLVCLQVHDDLQLHYDYTTVTLSTQTLSETVSDEVLGLKQAHVPKNAKAAPSIAGLPFDAYVLAARANQRLKEARSIYHSRRLWRKRR